MTKQELFTDPTFLRLPESQQKFVTELVNNGNDKLAAAHMTWQCANDASALTMANRCLKKAGVRKLTDAYFGIDARDLLPTREEMISLAWQKCQGAKDGAEAHKWFTSAASLAGFLARGSAPAPAAEPVKVDEATDDALMAELEQRGL